MMKKHSGQGDQLLDLLKKLRIEEVSEVLSDGFCLDCQSLLHARLQSVIDNKKSSAKSGVTAETSTKFHSADSSTHQHSSETSSESVNNRKWSAIGTPISGYSREQKGRIANSSPPSVNGTHPHPTVDNGLAVVEDEGIRIGQVGRKRDFVYIERVNGRPVNVVQGLELHTRVFNAEEQKKIVDCVYKFQRLGQSGQLRERTYTEPSKWMRGKGRITIQFGCCYNYAVDKKGNPPGILRDEEVDPLPPLFKEMIKRMIRWKVLPPSCIPNSCIVNIYEEGDCIPPHIDHHDFLRPFCTVSFLAECKILFGANIRTVGPGEFDGPVAIPLPLGSVFILNGNGADIAKHCVPGVPAKRISITFRKMDERKLPHSYVPDPDLLAVKLFGSSSPMAPSPVHDSKKIIHNQRGSSEESGNNIYKVDKDEFPPLGSLNLGNIRKSIRQ